MKIVYASRTGNVEKIVQEMNQEAFKINTGNEEIHEDYVLFTYTDGVGMVPKKVENFLENNYEHLKAVVVSGSTLRHKETFGFAGDKIVAKYRVTMLARLDGIGTEEERKRLKAMLS